MKNLFLILILALVTSMALADEGMWLFEELPKEQLKRDHNVDLSDDWLKQLRLSTAKLSNGGSGTVVSKSGLVLVTQHGLADALATLEDDISEKGFLAQTQAQELRLKGLELQILEKIETDGVDKAAPNAVALDHGARHHEYNYKTYTDVRLVFVPESEIAYFGGSSDNYEWPRHCLDMAFLRVYENGRPAQMPAHLKLAEAGPAKGEFVLTAGHPRTSDRSATMSHLRFLRDVRYPVSLDRLRRLEAALVDFSAMGNREADLAAEELDAVIHARRVYAGVLAGLQDPSLMAQRAQKEKALRANSDSSAWDMIEGKAGDFVEMYKKYYFFPRGHAVDSMFFEQGRAKLRNLEMPKTPIHPELERLKLEASLGQMVQWLGLDDPMVKLVLKGLSPRERAIELASNPSAMMELVEQLEEPSLTIEKNFVENVMTPVDKAYRELGLQNMGKTYPEATGTLRLGYGRVQGYGEGAYSFRPFTTIKSLQRRAQSAENSAPWSLSSRWTEATLEPEQHLNFLACLDVQDGSGGGPVVNLKGEVVGIVFDSNRWGIAADYFHNEERGRSVNVDAGAIRACLKSVYDAKSLINEL